MESRTYAIRGDPEQMFASLRAGLPPGANLVGNSTKGAIDALGSRIVDFSRSGDQLTITVRRGVLFYTEAQIWQLIEDRLRKYL